MPRISLHGRALEFDPVARMLYIDGAPYGVGSDYPSAKGKTLYVDSTNGAAGVVGESPSSPLSTLQAAIDRLDSYSVQDNAGSKIIVAHNHAETITGVGGLTFDVPGLSVIGLGSYNQRPRFLMDGATTVTGLVTAADVTISNMVFASGHSNVVTCFDVNAKGAWLDQIEFENHAANEDFLTCIKSTGTTDNAADGLRVTSCRWLTIDSDDLEFIELNATLRGARINNNFVVSAGTASPLILVATGKLLTAADIGWNRLVNAMTANELFISNDGTTNTGILHNNYVGHADVTGAHDPGWDAGGFRLFNNQSTSVDNLQGLLIPAADANL